MFDTMYYNQRKSSASFLFLAFNSNMSWPSWTRIAKIMALLKFLLFNCIRTRELYCIPSKWHVGSSNWLDHFLYPSTGRSIFPICCFPCKSEYIDQPRLLKHLFPVFHWTNKLRAPHIYKIGQKWRYINTYFCIDQIPPHLPFCSSLSKTKN